MKAVEETHLSTHSPCDSKERFSIRADFSNLPPRLSKAEGISQPVSLQP